MHHVEDVRRGERPLERRGSHVADVELVIDEIEARGDARGERDAARVRIDADDGAARVGLAEVRGEETEAAPDVEDAPLVGEERDP